jgi:hypothetical protein
MVGTEPILFSIAHNATTSQLKGSAILLDKFDTHFISHVFGIACMRIKKSDVVCTFLPPDLILLETRMSFRSNNIAEDSISH